MVTVVSPRRQRTMATLVDLARLLAGRAGRDHEAGRGDRSLH